MPSSRRLEYIDGLRGLACLWVVFHHAFEGEPSLPTPLRLLAQTGWLGVSLFLVLSGFCLYFPLVRRHPATELRVNLREFFTRRAQRILPPYYLSLLVAVGLIVRSQLHHGQPLHSLLKSLPLDLVLHLLLLNNLTAATFASLSSVCWSLALEWQLYLAFPLLVFGIARRGFRFVLAATLALGIGWQSIAVLQLGVSAQWLPELAVVYHALPARLFEFACGMCAAACVARPTLQSRRQALWLGGLCLVPALALVLLAYRLGPLVDTLWGMVFASLLVILRTSQWRSPLGRGLVFLGVRSYSIYLVHLLVMLALPIPAQLQNLPLLLGTCRVFMALMAGIGFYKIAENPFLRRNRPV